MNQAEVSKLVSRLKIHVKPKPGRIKNVDGPKGRLEKLRKTVTALLISDAIRYGDCHNQTMKMADFWLIEKQLVHKLFKVLEARKEKRQEQYLLTAQALGSQSQDTSTNWAATTPTEPPAASAEKS
ncbi:hypothetical protein B566_EDAN010901 [Ephemera danica]|nr:hypothetical protein B566_EDAN010901 [Ephemera danica]